MNSSPPPPPDYSALAKEQGLANTQAATTTAKLNNPNVITPYGTQSVTYGGNTLNEADYNAAQQKYNTESALYNQQKQQYDDKLSYYNNTRPEGYGPPDAFTASAPIAPDKSGFMYGDPTQATVTQTLAPDQQALLDKQTGIQLKLADLGSSAADRVGGILGQEFDISSMPKVNQFDLSSLPGMERPLDRGSLPSLPSVLDRSTLPNMPGTLDRGSLPGMGDVLDKSGLSKIQDSNATRAAVREAMLSRVNTDIGRDREGVNSQLAAAGIPVGSEAWKREQERLDRQQTDSRYQAELAASTAASQQFGQDLALRGQEIGAQGQRFGQTTANRQLTADEQSQAFSEAINARRLSSGEQSQEFGQQANNRQMATGEQSQAFGQSQAGRQQSVAEGQIAQQTSSDIRRQMIAEELAKRQLPLNEISALMSGSQVSNPFSQISGYQGGPVVQPSPLFQAGQSQFGAQQDVYNQDVASQNALLQGLFGLGGAALGGPPGALLAKKLYGG